ncbi:NifU family protein [Promethearchaeum syntrophicum]|uniref:NifU family protein n=1 Tax=Promethearchaeum syntrophicum TaxID=2594042 RepID=A0A5B9DAU3_9ARCH|nr:NifU family protein [Candidatus Prometheoarchaeum syntrophicum]QEE16095.1 Fe/S biogenesis protein NfuA [Candidatus Prometheoarchaeum syntrophicum]
MSETKWKDNVKVVIDQLRPSLQADGGDVAIVDIADDGTIKVELQGHCRGCPYSQMTLKNGIERLLKEKIPQVKEVVNI